MKSQSLWLAIVSFLSVSVWLLDDYVFPVQSLNEAGEGLNSGISNWQKKTTSALQDLDADGDLQSVVLVRLIDQQRIAKFRQATGARKMAILDRSGETVYSDFSDQELRILTTDFEQVMGLGNIQFQFSRAGLTVKYPFPQGLFIFIHDPQVTMPVTVCKSDRSYCEAYPQGVFTRDAIREPQSGWRVAYDGKPYVTRQIIWSRPAAVVWIHAVRPPLLLTWSFYPVLICISLAIYLIIHGKISQRIVPPVIPADLLAEHTKRVSEIREEIQEWQTMTASAADLFPPVAATLEKTVTGEVLPADSRSGLFEVSDKSTNSVRKNEPGTTVITLDKIKREFILLDPLDDELYLKQPKREIPAAAARARARAFGEEGRSLIDAVSGKPALLLRLQTKLENLIIPEWTSSLNDVYFDEVTDEEITQLLRQSAAGIGASAVLLSVYDPHKAAYAPVANWGLRPGTAANFYLLREDPLVYTAVNDILATPLDESIRTNRFLLKRFGADDPSEWSFLISISLHGSGVDGYAIAFYNSGNAEDQLRHIDRNELRHSLREIMPAIKYYLLPESPQYTDLQKELRTELRTVTNHGRKPVYVVHIHAAQKISAGDFSAIRYSVKSQLAPSERLIYLNPGHLVALLSKTDPEDLVDIIQSLVPDLETVTLRYPDQGRGFHMYT